MGMITKRHIMIICPNPSPPFHDSIGILIASQHMHIHIYQYMLSMILFRPLLDFTT